MITIFYLFQRKIKSDAFGNLTITVCRSIIEFTEKIMGIKDAYADILGSAGLSLPVVFRLLKAGSAGRVFAVLYNFVVNGRIINAIFRQKYKNAFIPKSIILEPTYSCNQNCPRCYVSHSEKTIDGNLLDSIVGQAWKLGIYRFEMMGGEPLMPEALDVILPVMEKYKRCVFSICTNCTQINAGFVKRLKKIKNIAFLLSMEGTESATDSYRGNGAYNAYKEAAAVLKQSKIPFGLSITLDSSTWKPQIEDSIIKDFTAQGGVVIYSNPRFDPKIKRFDEPDRIEYLKELQRLCKKFPIYWGDGYYGKMKSSKGIIPRHDNQVCIDPDGNVRANRFFPDPVFGNLASKKFIDILSDPALVSYKKNESGIADKRLAEEKPALEKAGFRVYDYQWAN
jgi:MoaA/NifB/PqqE/SkfB family radical SAM enzyme